VAELECRLGFGDTKRARSLRGREGLTARIADSLLCGLAWRLEG
jgi:hypothetical protein